MDSNVISIRTGKPKSPPLTVSEHTLTVAGDTYTVRRAVDADTQRGFVTICTEGGAMILVFSATYPREHIATLIIAWRAGHARGLERGRRDGIDSCIMREVT
ncbi:hypothetical protein [Tardiphaga sp. 813_E8_N1_3]|uniref:hypothetical protein n=1 Tax=Tardiphaga sp. 813_E8_N1_3 TaxID=3240760 RepID=UPI003F201696